MGFGVASVGSRTQSRAQLIFGKTAAPSGPTFSALNGWSITPSRLRPSIELRLFAGILLRRMQIVRRAPDILHNLLGRRLRRHGVLSHLHLNVGAR